MIHLYTCGLFSAAESYGKSTAVVEILLMLFVAFVLGYLLRYFLDKPKFKNWEKRYRELVGIQEETHRKLESVKEENRNLTGKLNDWRIKWEECQTTLRAYTERLNQLKTELEECYAKRETLPPQHNGDAPSEGMTALADIPEKSVRSDDLKIIEGIGPKIEKMLNEAGIYTWEELAVTPVEKLQEILETGGPAYKVHNPESWPYQARLAAEGKWDELRRWQDEHKWGRF